MRELFVEWFPGPHQTVDMCLCLMHALVFSVAFLGPVVPSVGTCAGRAVVPELERHIARERQIQSQRHRETETATEAESEIERGREREKEREKETGGIRVG